MTEKERIFSLAMSELSRRQRAAAISFGESEVSGRGVNPEALEARSKIVYIDRILDYISLGMRIPPSLKKTAGDRFNAIFSMDENELSAERERAKKIIDRDGREETAEEKKKYYCPICRDQGTLTDPDGKGKMCACAIDLLGKYIRENSGLPNGVFSLKAPGKELYSPKADRERFGSELSPLKAAEKGYLAGKDFISDFGPGSKTKLFITGRVGVGKTYLACCMGEEAARAGRYVAYVSISALMDALQPRLFNSDEEREAYLNRREYLEEADLLIIDDLGVENVTDRRMESLITILDKRSGAGRKTVITSNLGLREINSVYGERLFSRFADMKNSVNIRLLGDDIRLSGSLV